LVEQLKDEARKNEEPRDEELKNVELKDKGLNDDDMTQPFIFFCLTGHFMSGTSCITVREIP
jgi:hypothetical protein